MLENLTSWKISRKCLCVILIFVSIGGVYVNEYWRSYRKRLYLRKLRKDKQKTKLIHKGTFSSTYERMDLPTNGEVKRLLQMNMNELIEFLKENEDNYKTVFRLYQQQALSYDQRLNCVIEFLQLDVSDVDLSGPFAGIPISIKDNLSLKGYESYIGCSCFLGKPKATESCVLVKVLQRLGAIPFVKTAVPQTMMTILSSNPIDGIFKNPQNTRFICGGSSSGEGALVGAKGSLLGFGSDIGGSVRIPAAFCGVVGLKPTVGRISSKGVFKLGIHTLVQSVLGPICPDVTTCAFSMKCLLNSELMSKFDPQIPFLPFNDKKYNKTKLKIGYFTHDESYFVMPAMRRAVDETVKKLRERGHELIEWKPPRSGKEWWMLYLRAISLDGGRKLKMIIENDQIDSAIANGIIHTDSNIFTCIYNYFKYKLPNWIVDQDAKLFHQCSIETLTGSECVSLMSEIETFRADVINEWSKYELDAVLCPAGGFTALPLNPNFLYCPLLTYIFIWNLANFPAGTVPAIKVTRKDIDEMLSKPIYKSTPTLRKVSVSQQDTEGLSVSVQCVSLPWNEELCLNLMNEVEKVSSI